MDYEIEAGLDEFFEARLEEFESLFEEVAPELQEFVRGFRVVRWKPDDY